MHVGEMARDRCKAWKTDPIKKLCSRTFRVEDLIQVSQPLFPKWYSEETKRSRTSPMFTRFICAFCRVMRTLVSFETRQVAKPPHWHALSLLFPRDNIDFRSAQVEAHVKVVSKSIETTGGSHSIRIDDIWTACREDCQIPVITGA